MDDLHIALSVAIGVVILLMIIRACCVIVYRFYRPTCGYCVASQDEWDKFKLRCVMRVVSPVDINIDHASDKERELFENLGGNGVPFIAKVHPDGRRYTYDGERTADNMMRWVNNY